MCGGGGGEWLAAVAVAMAGAASWVAVVVCALYCKRCFKSVCFCIRHADRKHAQVNDR